MGIVRNISISVRSQAILVLALVELVLARCIYDLTVRHCGIRRHPVRVTPAFGPSWSSMVLRSFDSRSYLLGLGPQLFPCCLVMVIYRPNPRSALDARTAHCFHIGRRWPGASESERWVGTSLQ
jgi:hypothetical protein